MKKWEFCRVLVFGFEKLRENLKKIFKNGDGFKHLNLFFLI